MTWWDTINNSDVQIQTMMDDERWVKRVLVNGWNKESIKEKIHQCGHSERACNGLAKMENDCE